MSDRLKFETADLAAANLAKLAELFPEVVIEGKLNLELLRSLVGEEVFGDEAYEFTWVGKRAAIAEAARPIRKTLRPCIEESRDWDTTGNLYIEGDNLDVLKLLQEAYLGKVKMIYIDPPYNTGNDFIYRDDFAQSAEEFDEDSGAVDEEGNRLYRNTSSNGRFHSDWCSMMYARLRVARDLLRDDGVIFISIDDNEVAQLRNMCNEIYGESNFVAQIIWERAYAPINLKKHFSDSHDFILCYAKHIVDLVCNGLPRPESTNAKYSNPDSDPRGLWRTDNLSVGPAVQENIYEIVTPSGRSVLPPTGYSWRLSRTRLEEYLIDNRIWFGRENDGVPAIKRFLTEVKQSITPMTIWKYSDVGHSQDAMRELRDLFVGEKLFDYPKPVRLIKQALHLYSSPDSIILDFFSGSATTAHAVMQLNAEDGGSRRFIMVQLPEVCPEGSEGAKAGYSTICEIGKERIRRAGDKIKAEGGLTTEALDIGFRVLKLADSNMNDVFYAPDELTPDLLAENESNIKADRSELDLLFGFLLDRAMELTLPYIQEDIEGSTVYNYDDGALLACFAEQISDAVIVAMAERQPAIVVFRDSSFISSAQKINVAEIFKRYSEHTRIHVL